MHPRVLDSILRCLSLYLGYLVISHSIFRNADNLPITIKNITEAVDPALFTESLTSTLAHCITMRHFIFLANRAYELCLFGSAVADDLKTLYPSKALAKLWSIVSHSINDGYLSMVRARLHVSIGTCIGWMGTVIQPSMLHQLSQQIVLQLSRCFGQLVS